jgi:hypothetical protein
VTELNQTLGLVKIGISLTGSEAPTGGSGTLATITFTALQQATTCAVSVVQLQHILLLDSGLNPIPFDSVSALYFWKTPQPDPPVEGRVLDVYTQRGGQGMDVPGGIFGLGEEVQLISRVTYNGDPVQNKLVAYEVLDPLNHTVMVRTAVTNTIGMAWVTFRIPSLPESIGNWTVISIVDIVEKSVWDTLTFEVKISVPVGGYSVAYGRGTDAAPEVPYMAVAVAAVLILIGMKTRKLGRE